MSSCHACLGGAHRHGASVCTLTCCGLNCDCFGLESCDTTLGHFHRCISLRDGQRTTSLTSTCGHVNSYLCRGHRFDLTRRGCSHTTRLSPSTNSCSVCRGKFLLKLRGSCGNGVDTVSHLVDRCPRSRCMSSTLFRGKHSCILLRGDSSTTRTFRGLVHRFPLDDLTHGTNVRLNLLCCGSGRPRGTLTTCGRIVDGCPNDRRTGVTLRSLGSICVSLGSVGTCTDCIGSVNNGVHLRMNRRSSLACVTTRGLFVHNSGSNTHHDLVGCLRAFPRKTFDSGTGFCLNDVTFTGGRFSRTVRQFGSIVTDNSAGFLRRSITHATRVRCLDGSCPTTLRDFGHLRVMTRGPRGERTTHLNVVHYTLRAKRRGSTLLTTSRLLGRPGLSPRLRTRTHCMHTGTCVTRGRTGGTLTSLGRLDGSAHAMRNTRTGCLLTRLCCSAGSSGGTRGILVGFVRGNAPRRC